MNTDHLSLPPGVEPDADELDLGPIPAGFGPLSSKDVQQIRNGRLFGLGQTISRREVETAEVPEGLAQETPGVRAMLARLRDKTRAEELHRQEIAGLEAAAVVSETADEFLGRAIPNRGVVVDRVAEEGDNVVFAAAYKAGKTTTTLNLVRSLSSGESFLGRLAIGGGGQARRVYYVNLEVDERRMHDWLGRVLFEVGADALGRLRVVNRRGRGLRLSSPELRAALVEDLLAHKAQDLVVDCLRPAAASCGLSEDSNDDMGVFLAWLDEVKALAGVSTLWLVHHMGRRSETAEIGTERARGASVLDDWPDTRLLLTKDASERRFIRATGRMDDELPETRLDFDARSHRVWVPAGVDVDRGQNRRAAADAAQVDAVVQAVAAEPGITRNRLHDALGVAGVTNNERKAQMVSAAKLARRIHAHPGPRRSHLHYLAECCDGCGPDGPGECRDGRWVIVGGGLAVPDGAEL